MQDTIAQPVFLQTLLAGSTALTTATPKNIPLGVPGTPPNWPQPTVNTLFLNPGWWQVNWTINFVGTGTTTTAFQGGLNTVSATLPTADFGQTELYIVTTTVASTISLQGSFLYNIPQGGLSYYLVAQETFTAGTVAASGYVTAYQVMQ
jgi:hypothetical protein